MMKTILYTYVYDDGTERFFPQNPRQHQFGTKIYVKGLFNSENNAIKSMEKTLKYMNFWNSVIMDGRSFRRDGNSKPIFGENHIEEPQYFDKKNYKVIQLEIEV